MSNSITRRRFLSAVATTAVAAPAANACWWRRPVCVMPITDGSQSAVRTRPNVQSLNGTQLASLRRGVAAMKVLPVTDRRSWKFQAAIHGTNDPTFSNPLFNQCKHGSLEFFPWHRAYLHFFERILRWAANDSSLMLPFWDWSTHPALPEAFHTPPDTTNALFEPLRKANDGSALPSSVVVDDLATALAQIDFPASGFDGFSPDLEGSPHGAVHTLAGGIGGLMSSVPTAAGDPIFWLHHANIDRLWNVWLNLGGGRANPTDPAYLDKTYSFADETGGTTNVRVRDIIDSGRLGYGYEGVPNPPPSGRVMEPIPKATKAVVPKVVATSTAPENVGTGLDKLEAKPLGYEERRVKLNTVKESRPALTAALPGGGSTAPKVVVEIEGLSADAAPDFVYRVYVGLGEGERSEAILKRHYIGTINFFGKTKADRKGGGHDHGATEFNATFDTTRVLAGLHVAKKLDPDALTVTILATASVPPGVGAAQVNEKSAATAKAANVAYKRVSVRVMGE